MKIPITEVNVRGHNRKLKSGRVIPVIGHSRKIKKKKRVIERIVRKQTPTGISPDILSANPRAETIRIRTERKTNGKKTTGSRTYQAQAKSGLTFKRIKKRGDIDE